MSGPGKFDPQVILRYIESEQKIPAEMFSGMMLSENLEDQGMVFQIIDQYAYCIEEMPSQKDLLDFYLNYFEKCMLENQSGEFVESCHMTALSFVTFYKRLRLDDEVEDTQLERFRNMLKRVYETGDGDVQDCVINGALEHLFESPDIIAEFKEWKEDSSLRDAYLKALEFHGNPG